MTAPDLRDVDGAFPSASMTVRIAITTGDGEERDEDWPSVERFRSWAAAEGLTLDFVAYEEDADGEWVVVAKGRVGQAGKRTRP
jgi:hypothetical protein